MPSQHISADIDRPAEIVYAYARDPFNLPHWASGLAGTSVEFADGSWTTDSPMGTITIEFVPDNSYGVLDHFVTLPEGGETFYNPMRVIPDGDGCEVVFTLRRAAGMTDEEYARDAATIAADLDRLRTAVRQIAA